MIVGVTGKKQAGKDTVASYLALTHSAIVHSFAEPLYDMLSCMLGEEFPYLEDRSTPDKESIIPRYGVSLRHMLQTLGTEWGQKLIHKEVWVRHAESWLEEAAQDFGSDQCFVFSDVRFDHEAEFIKKYEGIIIKVIRASADFVVDEHESEKGIQDKYIDYVVSNNTTIVSLGSQVDRVMRML